MKPCLSEATTLPTAFDDDVAAYADGGCTAMEVWLTKLETHLETNSRAVPGTPRRATARQRLTPGWKSEIGRKIRAKGRNLSA